MLIVQQDVPMCPKCKAMMWQRHQDKDLYYVCHDNISHVYKVTSIGQAEIELIVTDTKEEN
jgi:hypothetical protein